MLVSSGRSTRSTLGRVGHTPSVEPILQNGVFVRVDQNAQPAPAPVPQANQLPVIEEEGEEGGEEDGVCDVVTVVCAILTCFDCLLLPTHTIQHLHSPTNTQNSYHRLPL
jgi:hypothetical protein